MSGRERKHHPGCLRHWLAPLLILLLVSGCGFQLRGSANLPDTLSPLMIRGIAPDSPIARDLADRLLESRLNLTRNPAEAASLITISQPRSHRRVLSVDSEGRAAEYELHQSLRFTLVSGSGESLLPQQRVSVTRSYINSEQQLLGKQQEEQVLRRDMQRDLVDLMMLRLQAQLD